MDEPDEPFKAPCFADASGKGTGGPEAPLEEVVVDAEPWSTFPGAVLPPRGRWMCCAGTHYLNAYFLDPPKEDTKLLLF